MRKYIIVTGSVLTLVLAALWGGGNYFLHSALAPKAGRENMERFFEGIRRDIPHIQPWIDSVRSHCLLRDTMIAMPSGERHHALYLPHPQAAGRTAVVLHGWRSASPKMLHIGRMYHHELHYNILLPDLHAHGLSQGDAIGMGWQERHDVVRWAKMAEQIFASSEGATRIVVHGVSMGAATTMNVAGMEAELPPYIRAFVADCGYTSAWDIFCAELHQRHGLPPFPLLYASTLMCQWRYGWEFCENSPLESVGRATRPILFIHGTDDTFVPTHMVHRLYEAKTHGPRHLWLAANTGHAESYHIHPEEYTQQVRQFVQEWVEK